jgi:2'-5' RNA ligase
MKNIWTDKPGYNTFQYLLVINPNEELRGKIRQAQNAFAEKYGSNIGQNDKPHILLASFTQYGMTEDKIVNRLKNIAMGYKPCKIELKDFSSFPSHTIYINITSRIAIQELVKSIRSQAQQLMKMDKENKPHFISEPHITIARKLQPYQYEQGWLEYSNSHFSGRFIADGMLLLKRRSGTSAYQIVQRFEFENMPVETKQGQLF